MLVEPTEVQTSSTITSLQWKKVGWYSLILMPAWSSSPHRCREAFLTTRASICGPGTMI